MGVGEIQVGNHPIHLLPCKRVYPRFVGDLTGFRDLSDLCPTIYGYTLCKGSCRNFGYNPEVMNMYTPSPNGHKINDVDLMARIRAGDKTACAICIEQHAPQIYRLALRLTQNEADAEDVMQETFLNAFQAIDSFEGRSTIATWLFRITYNAAMSRLRRTAPIDRSVEDTLDTAEDGALLPTQFFDWCCLPEQDFETAEVKNHLEQAMGQLSTSLRAVFILRELEGLSVQETADALNVSQDVVKTRLHRARLALREQLTFYFNPEKRL